MHDPGLGLFPGTLDLLVLKTLTLEPMHGWGIAQRLQHLSAEAFQVNQGSLYPALQRLTRKGWIKSEWRRTDANRRARYYELTPAGRAQLAHQVEHWRAFTSAVDRVLQAAY
ncbi:MAG: PadR family transcriptional regulator [Gemmatimonadota bacterium]